MRLIAKLFNVLFGNKKQEDIISAQEASRIAREAANAAAAKVREDELLKRLSTYNKPVVVTKTVVVKPCAEAITDKQERFITAIEAVINKHYGYRKVQFRGATKREAMSWISANVKEFETIKELNKMKRAAH